MWNASRYCETFTSVPDRPDDTIHQPTTPSAAPPAKISHNRGRSGGGMAPCHRNTRNGSRNTAPVVRARSRCAHSHQ